MVRIIRVAELVSVEECISATDLWTFESMWLHVRWISEACYWNFWDWNLE